VTELALKTGGALVLPVVWPVRRLMALLDRLTVFMDESEASQLRGALRIRRALAGLFLVYGVVFIVRALAAGGLPSIAQGIALMLAVALYVNRGGRFVRDWAPVLLGLYGYALTAGLAQRLTLPIHYLPQVEIDKLIGLGSVPTIWLQHHIYTGRTGPLEVFSAAMYASHFFGPLFLAFLLWWSRRHQGFTALMFGILTVSVLAEITFVLAPTAPPWLAAQHGLIPPVQHVLKQTLHDLHLTVLASVDGDPRRYNVVAAVPSLHVAWPVIGLLVIRAYGLPRFVFLVQLTQLVGVLFAVVYMGEHYVADAIAGAAYAIVAFWIVQFALGERRPRRSRLTRFREARPGDAAAELGVDVGL
jgi:PAP2 superfamily